MNLRLRAMWVCYPEGKRARKALDEQEGEECLPFAPLSGRRYPVTRLALPDTQAGIFGNDVRGTNTPMSGEVFPKKTHPLLHHHPSPAAARQTWCSGVPKETCK